VVGVARDDDADRLHLVHRGVRRVEQARARVEAHVAADDLAEGLFQIGHRGDYTSGGATAALPDTPQRGIVVARGSSMARAEAARSPHGLKIPRRARAHLEPATLPSVLRRLALALVLVLAAGADGEAAPAAPAFRVKTLDGRSTIDSRDLLGKKVLVLRFQAS